MGARARTYFLLLLGLEVQQGLALVLGCRFPAGARGPAGARNWGGVTLRRGGRGLARRTHVEEMMRCRLLISSPSCRTEICGAIGH